MSMLTLWRHRLREWLERRWRVPTPVLRLQNLRDRGFDARHVVDVGAYHGDFSAMVRTCFPLARLSIVEGAPDALRILAPRVAGWSQVTLFPVLAGASATTLPMLEQQSNSRIVSDGFAAAQPASAIRQVEVQPLDALLESAQVDLLKIDVQGHELAVLAGASRVLCNTRAVLVEVSVLPIGDAPPWTDVLSVLMDAGFVLVDLIEPKYRPRDGALWQVDLLLLRSGEALVTDRSW